MQQYSGVGNSLKTAMLLGGMGALIMCVSWYFFGQNSTALIIGLVLAIAMNGFTYWNSASLALKAMRARPVTEAEHPEMYAIVRELAATANQPMPALYVSPTQAPNAFATGRNPKNSAVCCTEGILQILDKRELRGVLAHELMHVYNRDILTSSIAATLASVVTMLGYAAMLFRGNSDNRPNPIAAMALMFLGPMAAGIIHMAISRTREYSADAGAAQLTGDPMALASALNKLAHGTKAAPLPPERDLVSASSMMIANPFKPGEKMASLFSTHPPMEDRIERLRRMAGQ